MKKNFFLFVSILAISIFSCTDTSDLDNLSLENTNPEFAIPIGKANFTMKDLIEKVGQNALIFVDPDGTIRLNYKGDLNIKNAEEAIFGSIQQKLDSFSIIPITDTVNQLPFNFPNGIRIDRMDLKKGEIYLSMFNTELEVYDVKWTFENVLDPQGNTLRDSFIVLPFQNFRDTINLNGYTLAPKDKEIQFVYKAIKSSSTGTASAVIPVFLMQIDSLQFSYADGYFDQIVHTSLPDTIEIDFFDEWTRGDIFFEDPTVKIYVENSFGIPTRADVKYFDVETIKNGRLPLESPSNSVIDFPYPKYPDEIGETKYDTFTYNAENSNIEDILFGGPKAILYHVYAITNPDKDTTIQGFITDKSSYRFGVEADLPLYGKSDGFYVTDTLKWDFSSYEKVKSAEFKIVSDNTLGLEVSVQGYFINEYNEILDSLFSEPKSIMTAADVDVEGYASGTARSEVFAPFSADRFQKIKAADRLVLAASFYTSEKGTKSVRVEANQGAEIRIGMKVQL